MHNFRIAFDILYRDCHVPVGWKKVTRHMVFAMKVDFTIKSRWVLDGHMNPDLEGSLYDGVVSRDIIRTKITYTALNGLDVVVDDISNANIQAP